ncbi:hypothetical protein L2E82_15037 [Cichorium intybus]|uniref:Uncharacterized protein n=1 Tax=Cichorium intybus TaxID=13427 RepID=A0ACB9F226_CICIN|nr:hypothetical protein L2E82_15037 [Cichorium intybus]
MTGKHVGDVGQVWRRRRWHQTDPNSYSKNPPCVGQEQDVLELAESNVTQHPDCQLMNLNRWLLMILCIPSQIY